VPGDHLQRWLTAYRNGNVTRPELSAVLHRVAAITSWQLILEVAGPVAPRPPGQGAVTEGRPVSAAAAYTSRVTAAVTEAVQAEGDFAGWLAAVLATVAGELGSSDALTAGRPGSWEASLVDQLVKGTVGYNDEYLTLPEWRTRAPVFDHEAYGLRVGEMEYQLVAAGHVDPRRFLAAAGHYYRDLWGGRLNNLPADQLNVQHVHAIHTTASTPQVPVLAVAGVTAKTRGSFPVTVLGEAWF
jgi:hypothetical protein